MILGLAVDGLLIVLLAAILVFALQLNRKLTAIRADQGEFGRLAASFAEAAARAEESVARLKIAAGAGRDEIDRADRVADDLRYLLERGTSLADRLESTVAAARDAAPILRRPGKATPQPAPSAAMPSPTAANTTATIEPALPSPTSPIKAARGGGGQPRSRAECELLAALRSAGLAG